MQIAVLGLGIIGSVWAKNLAADGLAVRTWNRTPKEGPGFSPRIQDAIRDAQVIFIVVADPAAVRAVLDQALDGLHAGQTIVQSSTVSPDATRDFARLVAPTGAAYIDAPFTGSKPAAEQRKTVFYLGGEADAIAAVNPVLVRIATRIMHVGPIGSASALKLAMNLNIAGVAAALAESLTFARRQGLSDETYFAALKINAGHSGIADLKEPKLRTDDFSPQFSLKHMAKDLRLARRSAGDLSLPLLQELLSQYDQGMARGWAEDDFIGLVRLAAQP